MAIKLILYTIELIVVQKLFLKKKQKNLQLKTSADFCFDKKKYYSVCVRACTCVCVYMTMLSLKYLYENDKGQRKL